MRRAVTRAPAAVAIEDGPHPIAAAGEVLVRVACVALCGSDANIVAGRHPYGRYPVVQGHEVSGVLTDEGTGLPPGTPVAIDPVLACGHCASCQQGRPNACDHLRVLGVHVDGGLAETIAVPVANLHAVGDLPLDLAALVEPLAVACHAVTQCQLPPGEPLVIAGAGSIGRSAALVARHRGHPVIVLDRNSTGLPWPEGITLRPMAQAPDAVSAALGTLAPTLLETTGASEVFAAALDWVATGGTLVTVSTSATALVSPVDLVRRELTMRGSRNSIGDFPEAIAIAADHHEFLRSTITARVAFEDAPTALERHAHEQPGKTIVVVDPSAPTAPPLKDTP